MATFKERKNGWHQAVIRRKGWPVQSKTFEKYSDAVAWARAVETEIDRGAFVSGREAERTTLSDVIKRFKSEYAPHHYRKREDEKEAWRSQCKHLDSGLGSYSLSALTPKVVTKYRDDRTKVASGTTVRKELYMLAKILKVAAHEFGIVLPAGNPVDNIRKPSEASARDRRLTAEEWKSLLAECHASRNPWLAPAVQLAVETAMRQGELLGLEWRHIDKKRKLALLLDPKKIKNEAPRAVPLSSAAMAVLAELDATDGKVLPVERLTLYHAFIAAAKRAEIVDYTFHDLRHEALSRLAERGDFTVLEMAAISGHKTLQMLKRYTHLQAEKLAAKLG